METTTTLQMKQALAIVNQKPQYMNRIFKILLASWAPIVLIFLINPIVFTNPIIHCAGHPEKYASQTDACDRDNMFDLKNDCVYSNEQTGTYRGGMYCGFADRRVLTQSALGFGCVIGRLLISVLADLKGRKFGCQLSLLIGIIGCVFNISGIYLQLFQLIVIGQILLGFCNSALININSLFITQFFTADPEYQQKANSYTFASWGVWQMLIGLISFCEISWFAYLAYLLLLSLIIMLWMFNKYTLESPLYLCLIQNNMSKAKQCLIKIGQINKINQSEFLILQRLLSSISFEGKSERISLIEMYKNMFKKKENIRMIIILSSVCISWALQYFIMNTLMERFSIGQSMAIFCVGLSEFVFYYSSSFFITKYKRKSAMITSTSLMVFFGSLFFLKTVSQNQPISALVLICLVAVQSLHSVFWFMIPIEFFSTQEISIAYGLLLGIGYTGRLIAPTAVYYGNQLGVNSLGLASILLFFMGVIPILFLQQTFKNSEERNLCVKLIENPEQIEMVMIQCRREKQSTSDSKPKDHLY